MSTYIKLEDGRVLAATDGSFDSILEAVAGQLKSRPDVLEGLVEWLLDQRCEVCGFGVGYLDMRELSARTQAEFKSACISVHEALKAEAEEPILLKKMSLLIAMWESIERGEPPEALTSPAYGIVPHDGERRGPGWT